MSRTVEAFIPKQFCMRKPYTNDQGVKLKIFQYVNTGNNELEKLFVELPVWDSFEIPKVLKELGGIFKLTLEDSGDWETLTAFEKLGGAMLTLDATPA